MEYVMENLAANLTDFAIYLAIGLVMLTGLVKCVFPLTRGSRRLRRGIQLLETSTGEGRPVWQDVLFLGKELQGPWRRFLVNAEQLDARGLNCNVEDYINDDTVIGGLGHLQLGEVIPSLLTSLGILGTFIGLMRGLGGLDMSDAAKTMDGIPKLISGMTFAFMTSIAGISCSLVFNMFNRMAYGSATSAIDDFTDAFADLVMQKPLEDNVQMICQQEDQSALLRHVTADMGQRVSEGIVTSVQQSLTPVTQSMNNFIMGQTQAQMDGVANIAGQFVNHMNRMLGNQFAQLGQTLSQVNQAQAVSFESLDRAMQASEEILNGMHQVQDTTKRVMEKFESYVDTIEKNNESTGAFLTHGSQVLSGMMTASQEQSDFMADLKSAQQDVKESMRSYADWSGRVMKAVEEQAEGAISMTSNMTAQMDMSSKRLAETYSAFVQNLSGGFGKAMNLFNENIHGALNAMNERLDEIRRLNSGNPSQTAALQKEAENCVQALSQLQRAVAAMTKEIEESEKPAKEA
ncbi:MAG: MotA/TolQ/ExbB proton channel family protein [Clostridia bacterium]|nr:MotA/TolQ/ExbB proton channel family protein [Clostridia bacterium]MBR0409200.1 MotA/TolQ/ExbB proton channel family protein [Clostridia bacterium]